MSSRLIDWLFYWFIDQLINQLIDWSINQVLDSDNSDYSFHFLNGFPCLENSIMQGMVDGKRKRGRLTASWLDDIKKYTGTSISNTTRIAEHHTHLEDSHTGHTGIWVCHMIWERDTFYFIMCKINHVMHYQWASFCHLYCCKVTISSVYFIFIGFGCSTMPRIVWMLPVECISWNRTTVTSKVLP